MLHTHITLPHHRYASPHLVSSPNSSLYSLYHTTNTGPHFPHFTLDIRVLTPHRQSITASRILTLFPEIDSSLATATTDDDNSVLDGYDAEQVRLMEEVCIVLDEDDKPIGSASKKVCT